MKLPVRFSGADIRIIVPTVADGQTAATEIGIEGYGECAAGPGHGSPVVIDQFDGVVRVLVFGDINSEEPTHTIDLAGALESARR